VADSLGKVGNGAGIKSFALSGLASGMDTSAIITQLLSIDAQPMTRMQAQEAKMQAKLALYQDLNSKVLAVKNAVDGIKNADLYSSRSAATSDISILTSTASDEAELGTHEVIVKQVGSTSTLSSSATATSLDPTKTLDQAGYRKSLQFVTRTVGGQTGEGGAFTINGTAVNYWKTDTLQNVIDRINSTVSGVTASYDKVTDKLTITRADGGQIQLSDTTGNFVQANGIPNNAVGTGSVSSTSLVAKAVKSDMKVSEAFSGAVTSGVMSINGIAMAVNADDTIQTMIDKINRSAAGVTASFSTTTNKITLTAKDLGSTAITLGADSSGLVRALHLDDAVTSLGQSTIVQVDGLDFERNSLKLADVIPGVTMDVKKANPADVNGNQEPIRITISHDSKKLKDAVKTFVDAYNKLVDFNDENQKGPEFEGTKVVKEGGALLGDSSLNQIMFSLRRSFTEQVSGMSADMNDMGDVGITLGDPLSVTANRSKLYIDEDKLAEKLTGDPEAVKKLFTKPKVGISETLDRVFKSLIGSPGATMDATIALQNQQIEDVTKRVEDFQAWLEKKRLDYIRVYSNMEASMSTIQNQGNSLITTLQQQLAMTANQR